MRTKAKNVANVNYMLPARCRSGEIEPERDQEIHTSIWQNVLESWTVLPDGPADLDFNKKANQKPQGIVWRGVVSLREDKPSNKLYNSTDWEERCKKLSQRCGKLICVNQILMGCGYHQEAEHPHCHFLLLGIIRRKCRVSAVKKRYLRKLL